MTNSVANDGQDYNREIVREFRANNGRVGGPWAHVDLLLLHHTGAKSGIERVTPLSYFPQRDDSLVVWASNGGSPTHPNWYHNLKANPQVQVEVGGRLLTVIAEELDQIARAGLWPTLIERYPQLAEAQAKTARLFPVFVLVPS